MTQDRPSQQVDEYELDTARAKTNAERLRIVADLIDATTAGDEVWARNIDGSLSPLYDEVFCFAESPIRLVTKRRPVLVISALEVFERPMIEAPALGTRYSLAIGFGNSTHANHTWEGIISEREWLASGRVFKTETAAARIGLHIRAALAKAVSQ